MLKDRMTKHLPKNNQTPPIPLDYGRGDTQGDIRREANALADCFGGWSQLAVAFGFGLVGLSIGLWVPEKIGFYLPVWLGLSGFIIGLLLPVPQDCYGWHRLGMSLLFAAIGGVIGWWLLSADGGALLGFCGFRIGCAIYDWKL